MATRKIEVQILGDDRQLSRTFGHAGKSARGFERDVGKASRGALAGSGAFRSMGRSLAFASGAFVGVASITAALRASVDAAEEFAKASKGLGAQLKANGESATSAASQIAKANAEMAKFGITAAESETALSRLDRATGNIGQAVKLEGLAANVAAASHISLAQAARIVGKVVQGTTTAFNRIGIVVKKGTSIQAALAIAFKKTAGAAAGASTPLTRLHAGVTALEVAVGEALLPTINRIADSLNRWLSNSENVARVQRDIRSAVKVASDALAAAKQIVEPLVGAFRALAKAVGGTRHAFELLFALGIAKKLGLISFALGASEGAGVAGGATRAAGAVRKLSRAMAVFQASVAIGGIRNAVLGLGSLEASAIATGIAFRVGLAGAIAVAGFELSKFIRRIPGVEKGGRQLGGGLEDLLSKSHGARIALGLTDPKTLGPSPAQAAANKAIRLATRAIRAQTTKAFVIPGAHPGLLEPGNLDLLHRKIARVGRDIATVLSVSIGTSKGETLIPRVIDGRIVSITKAIEHFKKTGENLGTFKNIKDANSYAEALHRQQEAFYGSARGARTLAQVAEILRNRFHLAQHDIDVFFATARRAAARGAPDVLARVVASGANVFPGTAGRRRPTSLQGRLNLDELRLADAQRAQNVKLQRAILVDEERLTLKLRAQAKTLKDRTKFAQQAAQIEDQIRAIDQQAASDAKTRRAAAAAARKARREAAKAAAELARQFSIPLRAQLAEAKAAATKGTKDDLAAARAIKKLAQKALKSGRLGLQGQIDAWDAITSASQQIADLVKKQAKDTTTAFKKANLNKLLSGLGLTPAQVRAARARLSQVGAGGTVPGTGQGAFGFALPGDIVIHNSLNVDGRKMAGNTTRHQQRRDRRNPKQKRGQHAK